MHGHYTHAHDAPCITSLMYMHHWATQCIIILYLDTTVTYLSCSWQVVGEWWLQESIAIQ